MVRIFIGLLIGLIVGSLGTIQYLSSGQGNIRLMTSPQIHHLEEQVKLSHQQIEQLTKKLEDAAATMEKTAARFGALEQQVEALRPSSTIEGSHSSKLPEAATPPPSSATPSSESPNQPAESPSPS